MPGQISAWLVKQAIHAWQVTHGLFFCRDWCILVLEGEKLNSELMQYGQFALQAMPSVIKLSAQTIYSLPNQSHQASNKETHQHTDVHEVKWSDIYVC